MTAPGIFEDRARGSASGSEPAVHRLRHRLVRLRQRRLAGHPRGERRREPERRRRSAAGTIRFRSDSASSCSAISAVADSRTSSASAGAVFELVGGRTRRGVRRRRQRRRHRRPRRQRRGPDAPADQRRRQPQSLDRTASRERAAEARHGRRARRSHARRRPALWRRARADGSYASANDPRVLVGLGASTDAPRVRVIWPDGRSEEFPVRAQSIATPRSPRVRRSEPGSRELSAPVNRNAVNRNAASGLAWILLALAGACSNGPASAPPSATQTNLSPAPTESLAAVTLPDLSSSPHPCGCRSAQGDTTHSTSASRTAASLPHRSGTAVRRTRQRADGGDLLR